REVAEDNRVTADRGVGRNSGRWKVVRQFLRLAVNGEAGDDGSYSGGFAETNGLLPYEALAVDAGGDGISRKRRDNRRNAGRCCHGQADRSTAAGECGIA